MPYSYAFVICSLFNNSFADSNIDKGFDILSTLIKQLNNLDNALYLGRILYDSNSSF